MLQINVPPFRRIIWIMPAAFALHIGEEFVGGFARWVTEVVGGTMDVPAFLINNAGFMAVLIALTAWAALRPSALSAFLLITWASANLFWDFLFHLITTAAYDHYSPGLFTASLLYYPISLVIGAIAWKEGVLPRAGFIASTALGAGLMGFVIWAGLFHFAL